MKNNIFKIFSLKRGGKQEERQIPLNSLSFNGISGYASSKAMSLSAVYAAVNQISNSVALLPVNIYRIIKGKKRTDTEHAVYSILNRKVNETMSHYNFMKMMTESVMLRGEAFAYIDRDEDLTVRGLYFIPAENVTVMKIGNTFKYIVTGMAKAVDGVNMIHVYQHLDMNTNRGISVISYASRTLKAANEAESHSSNFFKSGANLSGIIKASATLTNEQKKQIKTSWSEAFSNNNTDVSVAVLPQGLDYQPISISPEDAQLLESRQYTVIEIARFFNISPIKLFDLSHTSYNTMEQVQLSYLTETVTPYVRMFQEEFQSKLFTPSEQNRMSMDFDYEELLKPDKQTQAEFFKTLLVNGIMSLNEVREKLSLPKVDNGDVHTIQLNMTTLDNIISGANLKAPENDNKYKQNDNELKTDKENAEDNQ